jgi:hypothetical protein
MGLTVAPGFLGARGRLTGDFGMLELKSARQRGGTQALETQTLTDC